MASPSRILSIATAGILAVLSIVIGYFLFGDDRFGRDSSYTWWVGIALGIVLQRARFFFATCGKRLKKGRSVRSSGF